MAASAGRKSALALATCVLALAACDEPDIVRPPTIFEWTFLGLTDETVTAIALTPDGLYAGTRFSGVHRYQAGTNWEPIGLDHAMIGSLLYHKTSGLLLAGMTSNAEETTAAAIYASADGGDTWEPRDGGIASAEGYREWAYSLAAHGDTLYWGQSMSILRSVDAGLTWSYVWGGPDMFGTGVNAIWVSRFNPETVYAAAGSADFRAILSRSRNGGESWDVITSPPTNADAAASDVAEDPFVPGRIWIAVLQIFRSDDSGDDWEPVEGGADRLILSRNRFLGFYGSLSDDLEEGTGLVESLDRGETWHPVEVPTDVGYFRSVLLGEDGQLYVGTNEGVWLMELTTG